MGVIGVRHNPRNGFSVCAVALLLTIPEAWAGGWPLAPGTGEIITSVTFLSADERYEADGSRRATSRYTKLEIAPYLEYGLTAKLTAIGEAAWASETTDYFGTEYSNSGVARLKAGLRYALGSWNETLFSLQPVATLHLMSAGDDPAATGRGDLDAELAVVMARSETLSGFDIFSVQEVAYRWRDQGRPDDVRADVTLGIRPWAGGLLLLKSLNTVAVKETAAGDLYQSSKLGLSLVQALPEAVASGWHAEAGIEQTIVGRSTVHDTTGKIALWYRF